jgi:hypothetical protein
MSLSDTVTAEYYQDRASLDYDENHKHPEFPSYGKSPMPAIILEAFFYLLRNMKCIFMNAFRVVSVFS